MKIKWICLRNKLILPAIIAIVIAITSITFINAIIVSSIASTNITDPQFYTSNVQVTEPHNEFGMISLIPFIVLFSLFGFLLVWIKESSKPCIIKETSTIDSVVNGVFTITDLILFLIVIILFSIGLIYGVVSIIINPFYIIFMIVSISMAYLIYLGINSS